MCAILVCLLVLLCDVCWCCCFFVVLVFFSKSEMRETRKDFDGVMREKKQEGFFSSSKEATQLCVFHVASYHPDAFFPDSLIQREQKKRDRQAASSCDGVLLFVHDVTWIVGDDSL